MWLLAALSALGIALAVLAFLTYGLWRMLPALVREFVTYNGPDEPQKPDEEKQP